jgi:poly-beta-1,6-N-acetyl-D-glucosamine synthase
VAGSVLVRNSRDNLWTRMQEWDYFLGIASVKRMQGLYQGTLVAQGAFGLYRTCAVAAAGGWPDAVGEDIVLTWQLMRQGRASIRAVGGRLHRRPGPAGPSRPPACPLGPGHGRGPPQREALEPAARPAALPHRDRPAHPRPRRRLRAGVVNLLGLRVRRNVLGFVGFVLAYQMLMSPIAVAGYGQELLGLRRRWK